MDRVLLYIGCFFTSFLTMLDAQRTTSNQFLPKSYVVYRTDSIIEIDGLGAESVWSKAKYTEYFVDIEGESKPKPTHNTRIKMLWDSDFLYVLAEMEEPHVWATLAQRDTVVYYDDDFEVFIDPDGDTHYYTEIEVNALNTVWDLMLMRPYSVDKLDKVLWRWDIPKLRTAVQINGTINDPTDIDIGWNVEMAIPMETLIEFSGKKSSPTEGDTWRINFSRVDWQMDILGSKYQKIKDRNGKVIPENNWVWSPQGEVAMHIPERWGYLQFSSNIAGENTVDFVMPKDEPYKNALRAYYHQVVDYHKKNSMYPKSLVPLDEKYANDIDCDFIPSLESTTRQFTISAVSCNDQSVYIINQEGKIWKE